ncbi:hypothetical protein JZU46_00045 [bacterium]|jgi:hypothetical protein|nr:hypothetical protein [bacterium]
MAISPESGVTHVHELASVPTAKPHPGSTRDCNGNKTDTCFKVHVGFKANKSLASQPSFHCMLLLSGAFTTQALKVLGAQRRKVMAQQDAPVLAKQLEATARNRDYFYPTFN